MNTVQQNRVEQKAADASRVDFHTRFIPKKIFLFPYGRGLGRKEKLFLGQVGPVGRQQIRRSSINNCCRKEGSDVSRPRPPFQIEEEIVQGRDAICGAGRSGSAVAHSTLFVCPTFLECSRSLPISECIQLYLSDFRYTQYFICDRGVSHSQIIFSPINPGFYFSTSPVEYNCDRFILL